MGGANGTMELNDREEEANVGNNLRLNRVFTRRGRGATSKAIGLIAWKVQKSTDESTEEY